MSEQPPSPNPASKRNRSPNYPAFDLEDALEKAQQVWNEDRRASVSAASLAAHWGFSEKSSSVLKAVGALRQFGLLTKDDSSQYKLTDLAIQIIANEDKASPVRLAHIKKCALNPKLYSELWQKYSGQLPSDVTIKTYLIAEREFNPDSVNSLLKDLRKTFSFANITPEDYAKQKPEELSGDGQLKASAIQAANGTSLRPQFGQPIVIQAPPPPLKAASEGKELSLPLENGREVKIPIPMSEEDFELFTQTLQLWKKRIVKTPAPIQFQDSMEET